MVIKLLLISFFYHKHSVELTISRFPKNGVIQIQCFTYFVHRRLLFHLMAKKKNKDSIIPIDPCEWDVQKSNMTICTMMSPFCPFSPCVPGSPETARHSLGKGFWVDPRITYCDLWWQRNVLIVWRTVEFWQTFPSWGSLLPSLSKGALIPWKNEKTDKFRGA